MINHVKALECRRHWRVLSLETTTPTWLPHGASLSLVVSSPQVRAKMCVVIVSGVRVTEAVLLFSAESLLLCEGFTLSPAGDVCCRKHQPSRCCSQ